MWQLTRDTWHMTCDTWPVTHGGEWTYSQHFSSQALTVWDWQCLGDSELKDHRLSQWMTKVFIKQPRLHRVCETPLSLTEWVSGPFPPYLQNITNPKPLELGTWNLETMFTSPNMSHVMCHMSPVTCHKSFFLSFIYKGVKLVGGGSVINGAYPI